MPATVKQGTSTPPSAQEPLTIVDCDIHPMTNARDPGLGEFLPARWREYTHLIGSRNVAEEATRPRQRPYATRTDASPPSGAMPGGDPVFAKEHHLDAYNISAGILNNLAGLMYRGSANHPVAFAAAMCSAINDWHEDRWFSTDPRWFASIVCPYELPGEAVKEIARCRERNDRYVQVLLERRADAPIGNPRYWPIFEACAHYGIPLAFHVGGNRRVTACGPPNYYFEEHCDFALSNFSAVASLIFEGVFDRFPGLRIVFVEQNWSWVVPFMWRLDRAWSILRAEVPHLERPPSDYVREHFWFTTQPMEEPDDIREHAAVYRMLEESGLGDKLMYSSDYPHWDFDAPGESVPATLSADVRRRILGGNAYALYQLGEPILIAAEARSK